MKARELFEKMFPDIRKQRVQQERTDRAGTRSNQEQVEQGEGGGNVNIPGLLLLKLILCFVK